MRIARSLWAAVAAATVVGVPLQAGPSCDSLTYLALPGMKISLAQLVRPGSFAPPASFTESLPSGDATYVKYADLRAFCRIVASVTRSNDSDIKVEIWLPSPSAWNDMFVGIGNGGWAGRIYYDRMSIPLTRGYAVAATDTGHQCVEEDTSFALEHHEKLMDYGYRAVHEMTVIGHHRS